MNDRQSYEELKEIVRTNICAQCEKPLVLRWNNELAVHEAICGNDHSHKGFKRQLTLTEAYKTGEPLPLEIEQNIEKKLGTKPKGTAVPEGLRLLPKAISADLQTGELLSPEKTQALIAYAERYGLDPYRGHICLMFGEPYITLDGYLYYARRSGEKFSLYSSPMSPEDRLTYQVPEGAYAWLATCKLPERGLKVLGQGIITKEELEAKSKKDPTMPRYPIINAKPTIMAQKRAEWQALKRAFPLEVKE